MGCTVCYRGKGANAVVQCAMAKCGRGAHVMCARDAAGGTLVPNLYQCQPVVVDGAEVEGWAFFCRQHVPDRKYETPPLEAQRRRHTELIDLFNEEAPRGRFGAVAQRLVEEGVAVPLAGRSSPPPRRRPTALVHLLAVETCAGLCGTNGRGRPCGRSCRFLSCVAARSSSTSAAAAAAARRPAPAPAPAPARRRRVVVDRRRARRRGAAQLIAAQLTAAGRGDDADDDDAEAMCLTGANVCAPEEEDEEMGEAAEDAEDGDDHRRRLRHCGCSDGGGGGRRRAVGGARRSTRARAAHSPRRSARTRSSARCCCTTSRSTAAAAPPLPGGGGGARAPRPGALPVRTRQLLYVLLARRCRPDAGAGAGAFARDAGGWPIDLNDDDDYDVVAGGEASPCPSTAMPPTAPSSRCRRPSSSFASRRLRRVAALAEVGDAQGAAASHSATSCGAWRRSQRAGCCSRTTAAGCGWLRLRRAATCDGRDTAWPAPGARALLLRREQGVRRARGAVIRKGSFVIEYVGEYISSEAERRVRLCPRNDTCSPRRDHR